MRQSEKSNKNRIRKWQKRIVVILGIVIVGISIIHFSDSRTRVERDFEKALEKFVESGEKRILLRYLTDFQWDRVYTFSPYEVSSWKGRHCLTDEGHWGLQFVNSNNEFIPICIRRGIFEQPQSAKKLSILPRGESRCYLPDDTVLIYHGKNGRFSSTEIAGTTCN